MPIYGKRKYAPKRKTTTRRPRKYAARVYKKSSFAARVKKVIHSQIENKVQSFSTANVALAYAGAVTNPTYLNLAPLIGTGTQQNGRIGNEINVVQSTIRGYLNLLPYSVATNTGDVPTLVKMWLCRRKANNTGDGDVPVTADFAAFFQNGNSAAGFQSNTLDMLLRPNMDYWTVFQTKTIQLYSNASPDTSVSITPQNSNVSVPWSFNLTKHLGKCKYNDNTSNYPSNKELFLVFQGVRCDGTTTALGTFAEIHYVVEHKYEDA